MGLCKPWGILGDTGGAPPPSRILLETTECMTLRTATDLDNVDIANLRLSVLSDFNTDQRSQFCWHAKNPRLYIFSTALVVPVGD